LAGRTIGEAFDSFTFDGSGLGQAGGLACADAPQ
jgi:hypothetical protein